MYRILPSLIVVCTLLAATSAFADDSANQTPANQRLQTVMNQRYLRGCMMKRMIADKALAYNEAKRACTEQFRARIDAQVRPLAASAAQTGP